MRLGEFNPEEFRRVIGYLESMRFLDENYLVLAMDFGELLTGEKEALKYLRKGKEVAEILWRKFGMKLVLDGVGLKSVTKKCYLREEPNAELDEIIKKKKKGEKKGGKDDKKAPKKEDPKKGKKDESKL